MHNPPKVLFIEDDILLIEVCLARFSQENFMTIIARDGEQGLQKIISEKPDLILLDLVLPKLNGFELLKKIKSDSQTIKIPVIILSNLGQENEIEKGLKLGAVDYLIKAEWSINAVVDKIKEQLEKIESKRR